MLSIENISKTFRDSRGQDVPAVRGLSFTVAPGELLVLTGPSGCGKTTTLRMIAGLEQVSDGRIQLGGALIHNLPPQDRDIAMVFQVAALLPHLTVGQNLAFGLKLRKLPSGEVERRVAGATGILDLADKLTRLPGELSGGEAQRVALGRALVRQPGALLLDEPLSHLDAMTRKRLRREILCLHQRLQVPAIYVTHDQTEALQLGHRIAVMKGGVLQQIGTAEEIRQKPANDFVAEFFET